VLVAYGSGLGGLYVSTAAAQAGLRRFREVIERNLDHWDEHVAAVTEYARRIGRTTAWTTVSRGGGTVSTRDFLEALARVEAPEEEGFIGGCPFLHAHH
jgi:hypothetical protein